MIIIIQNTITGNASFIKRKGISSDPYEFVSLRLPTVKITSLQSTGESLKTSISLSFTVFKLEKRQSLFDGLIFCCVFSKVSLPTLAKNSLKFSAFSSNSCSLIVSLYSWLWGVKRLHERCRAKLSVLMFYGVRPFKKVWVILQHQVRFLNIAPYIISHNRYFAEMANSTFMRNFCLKATLDIKKCTYL